MITMQEGGLITCQKVRKRMYEDDKHERAEQCELEVSDIPSNERQHSIASVLVDLGARIVSRVHTVKITQQPKDDLEEFDHQTDFDIRFVDLPMQNTDQARSSFATSGIQFWSTLRQRRLLFPIALLLVVLFVAGSSPYQYLLPSSTSSHAGSIPTAQDSAIDMAAQDVQVTGWQRQYTGVSIVVIPGVVVGRSSTSDGPATWTAATAPGGCPQGPSIGSSHAIGRVPVWVGGFDGPYAMLHLPPLTTSNLHNWTGWVIPLQVGIKFSFVGPVTLTLGNVGDGPPPIFDGGSGGTYSSTLIFTHDTPGKVPAFNTGRTVYIWDIKVRFSGAGCYYMTANWPGGNWQILFSTGQ